MAKAIIHSRPPTFVSISTLARELDMSESTVRCMVNKGTLPRPVQLSGGSVRWRWSDVQDRLGGQVSNSQSPSADPYLVGVINAAKA